uniref:B30.2/SPRY domain-containing protein n=1 Tax=Neogobius melanostomus TaxID=47308 RepID=A0A8C6SHG9_9GOBI
MEAVREQRAAVNKAISEATRRLQNVPKNQPPNCSTLRRYTFLVELTQRPLEEEELQLGSGALLDQAKHLGNLDFHIWSSLRPEVRYCPVVLDPNTVTADLSLSADLRSMSQQGPPQLPLNSERLSGSYWAVLGAEGLSAGVHSWDVDVSGSGYWAVGVASRCERLPGVLSELWRVSWSPDGLEAGTLTGRPAVLPLARGPHTVRVVLDLDRKDLSFFAPGTTSPLHSFTLPPTGGALFPYFSLETTAVYGSSHRTSRCQRELIRFNRLRSLGVTTVMSYGNSLLPV